MFLKQRVNISRTSLLPKEGFSLLIGGKKEESKKLLPALSRMVQTTSEFLLIDTCQTQHSQPMLLSTVFSSSSAHLLPRSSEPPPALKGRRPQVSLLFPARRQEHQGLSPCPEPQLCWAQQPSLLSYRCGSSPPTSSRRSGATQNGDLTSTAPGPGPQ